MLPAPRQKQPQISPIFISDKVTLHGSREKDGKLRPSYAGMGRYEGRSAGRSAGKLAGAERVVPTSRREGAMTPLSKTRTPLRPPSFFRL